MAAGRADGHRVQATSVPGVAQRAGSTSYYVEVAPKSNPEAILGLVPLKGRVDLVVSSELLETARVLSAGFVSPKRTTVISSTARFHSTAEEIAMGDGSYSEENVQKAVEQMAKVSFLLDLGKLATDNKTIVSATMFGALSGCGALPWDVETARAVLSDDRSRAGFDAAAKAVAKLQNHTAKAEPSDALPAPAPAMALAELPRVLKGYSDTLLRGKSAYKKIWDGIVTQAIDAGHEGKDAPKLRAAIGAALADENHEKLDNLLTGTPQAPPILTRPKMPVLAQRDANA